MKISLEGVAGVIVIVGVGDSCSRYGDRVVARRYGEYIGSYSVCQGNESS